MTKGLGDESRVMVVASKTEFIERGRVARAARDVHRWPWQKMRRNWSVKTTTTQLTEVVVGHSVILYQQKRYNICKYRMFPLFLPLCGQCWLSIKLLFFSHVQ